MYDDLTPRLWVFAVKRLNNIARTLGTKVMARTAYRAHLPIEVALAACKGTTCTSMDGGVLMERVGPFVEPELPACKACSATARFPLVG